jgi:hypothetical protein
MAYISRENLKTLLNNNVVEIKFNRRHPTQTSATRRMFCVGAYPSFHSNPFLASVDAQNFLGYRYPKGVAPYHPRPFFNPDEKNLVITWDIFMMNYRCITVNGCNVIRAYPVDTPNNQTEFWKYFNSTIVPMSVAEKMSFHNK